MIQEILKEWNITEEAKQINSNTWNVGRQYILKEYTDKSLLERNIILMKTLHQEGIPVPELFSTVQGSDMVTISTDTEAGARWYLLMECLPGSKMTDLNECDGKWFYQFGVTLGLLHRAFQKCESKMEIWDNNLYTEMSGWVIDTLNQSWPDCISPKDVEAAIHILGEHAQTLPRQMIHRDVHLGNFLFESGKFTGYIDFDLSQKNIRIFDLCYFLMGLLQEKEYGHMDEERWLDIVSQVVNGYDSVLTLTEEERLMIPCVMENIEILFVACFVGEKNAILTYESARMYQYIKERESAIAIVIGKNSKI